MQKIFSTKEKTEKIAENGGKSVDAVVHDIWEALNSVYYNGELDSSEVKDIVLDYLSKYHSPQGMAKDLMKTWQEGDDAEYEEWAKANEEFERMKRKVEEEAKKKDTEGKPQSIKPIGTGDFGDIYDQFKGKPQEAIEFLMEKKGGEAVGALRHKDIGDIDLVWGEEGTGKSDGYGLAKLAKYHPEVLGNLQEILDDMEVVSCSENRANLESKTHKAAVRLTWNDAKKSWLLTAFEKKNSVPDNTTDTVETQVGRQNDTATLQNTVSDSKGNENNPNVQGNGEKNDGADGANGANELDIVNSIKQSGAEKKRELEEQVTREKAAGVKFLKTVHPKSGAKVYTKIVDGKELPSSYNEYKEAEKQGAAVSGEAYFKAKQSLWRLDKLKAQYPDLKTVEDIDNAIIAKNPKETTKQSIWGF